MHDEDPVRLHLEVYEAEESILRIAFVALLAFGAVLVAILAFLLVL